MRFGNRVQASAEDHFAVGQIEVDGELRTVLGFLPTARDGAGIVVAMTLPN
jgi:hypothetical protein